MGWVCCVQMGQTMATLAETVQQHNELTINIAQDMEQAYMQPSVVPPLVVALTLCVCLVCVCVCVVDACVIISAHNVEKGQVCLHVLLLWLGSCALQSSNCNACCWLDAVTRMSL